MDFALFWTCERVQCVSFLAAVGSSRSFLHRLRLSTQLLCALEVFARSPQSIPNTTANQVHAHVGGHCFMAKAAYGCCVWQPSKRVLNQPLSSLSLQSICGQCCPYDFAPLPHFPKESNSIVKSWQISFSNTSVQRL